MKDSKSVKCPSCKKVFKVDDSVFTDIVKQVRDTQFQEEVNARLAAAEKEKAAALELIETKIKADFQQQLANKQQEINELQYKSKSQLVSEVSKKEDEIRALKSTIEQAETQKKLEVSTAVNEIEKVKNQLENELASEDWITVPAETSILFDQDIKSLWKNVSSQHAIDL